VGFHIKLASAPKPSDPWWRKALAYLWLGVVITVSAPIALVVVPTVSVLGWLLGWKTTQDMTRAEVDTTIEDFIHGRGDPWGWDDFTSVKITDPEMEVVRQRCLRVESDYPAKDGGYCSPEGVEELKKIARELRMPRNTEANALASPPTP